MKDLETLINQLALIRPLVGARDVGRLIQLSETFREQLRACVANYAAMYTSLQMIEYDEDGQLEDVTDERTPERSSIATEQLSTLLSRNAGLLADMISIKQRFTTLTPVTFPIPQLPFTSLVFPLQPGTTLVLSDYGVKEYGRSFASSFWMTNQGSFTTVNPRLANPIIISSAFGTSGFVGCQLHSVILVCEIDSSGPELPLQDQTHVLFTYDRNNNVYYAATGTKVNDNFVIKLVYQHAGGVGYEYVDDLVWRVYKSAMPAIGWAGSITSIRPADWVRNTLKLLNFLPVGSQSLNLETNIMVPDSANVIADCTRVFKDTVQELLHLCGDLNPLSDDEMDLLEWS